MYPDQSLYAVTSVPSVVKRINNALQRADQLHHAEGETTSTGSLHRGRRRSRIRRRCSTHTS